MNLYKRADGFMSSVAKVFGGAGTAVSKADEAFGKAREMLYVAVPITALATAYMASRLLSPTAVKDNVSDVVINNNEKANLMQSLRELNRLEAMKALVSKAKPHDQFI